MKKVLFIAPHLSTGGMPEFLRMRIQQLLEHSSLDIYVVEYSEYSPDFTVQRDQIIKLVGPEKFFSLGTFSNDSLLLEEKFNTIKKLVQRYSFDIIHIDEIIEQFDNFNGIHTELLNFLYNEDRTWKIVETPHSVAFNDSSIKKYIPDGLLYCSDYHLKQDLERLHSQVPHEVVEYPIIDRTQNNLPNPYEFDYSNKKNILNVGLWTPGKNQEEVIRLAKIFEKEYSDGYCFHFIGNQASNFEDYWGPLTHNLPNNVKIWGEQSNVEAFIKHSDAVIHTSLFELNPLILKEARSYGKKLVLRYLPTYNRTYNSLALYLTDNDRKNVESIVHYIDHGKTSPPISPIDEGRVFATKHIDFYNLLQNHYDQQSYGINYLIHSISFGDTLAATPTLRYLSNSHNSKINVVTHCKKAFTNNPYINQLLSFEEYVEKFKVPAEITYESFTSAGTLDGNQIEKKFTHIDIRQIHAIDLGFQLTPDQLHYDFYPDKFSLDIELPENYVVLHITDNWPNRTWAYENWYALIEWLAENNIFTVLIGQGYAEKLHASSGKSTLNKVCPSFDNLYGIDLSEQGTISDMWHVIDRAAAIVTMDSGPLHLAGTTDSYIIQLGSAIHPYLRAPFRNGDQHYKYSFVGGSCKLFCNSNLKYNVAEWGHINAVPPLPGCLENKKTFECHPSVTQVIKALKNSLKLLSTSERDLKFGIYTSFFNCEEYVDSAFTTVESLEYSNFEWHITDDFSDDDTYKAIMQRLEKSPIREKIIYRNQSFKKEMYWKPNKFFDESFDWIILVDSDDDVDKNCLTVYNSILKSTKDIAIVTSDFHKLNALDNSLHSISYIKNDEKLSSKIDKYHPTCDYLDNISYSCFGTLRAFKNLPDLEFNILDNLACAEDSYRLFWMNSYGKYLHIPRALYKWTLRKNSESQTPSIPSNFNGNFDIALDKLVYSDKGIDQRYSNIYTETCSIQSIPFDKLPSLKNINIITRHLTQEEKILLRNLYPEKKLHFSHKLHDINVVCLNHVNEYQLQTLLINSQKNNKLLLYYQNTLKYSSIDKLESDVNRKVENINDILSKNNFTYAWWKYIRHVVFYINL